LNLLLFYKKIEDEEIQKQHDKTSHKTANSAENKARTLKKRNDSALKISPKWICVLSAQSRAENAKANKLLILKVDTELSFIVSGIVESFQNLRSFFGKRVTVSTPAPFYAE
jgi:hypothetical protein